MIKEFKEFLMRGNVVDLAVAVIIGGAFTTIVNSLVNDIIMPVVGILMGGVDFSGLALKIGEATLTYGNFIQSIFTFVIIAFVLFMIVRTMNKLKKPAEAAPAGPTEVELLTEIRDALAKKK